MVWCARAALLPHYCTCLSFLLVLSVRIRCCRHRPPQGQDTAAREQGRASTQPHASGHSYSSFRFPLFLFLCVANPHPTPPHCTPPLSPFSFFLSLPCSIHLLLPSSPSFTTTTTHVPIQAPARCFAAALPTHSLMTPMCVLLHFLRPPPPCLENAYVRMDVVAGRAAPLSPPFVCVCAFCLGPIVGSVYPHHGPSQRVRSPSTVPQPSAFRRFALFRLNWGAWARRGLVWLCVWPSLFCPRISASLSCWCGFPCPFYSPSPFPLPLDEVVRPASWRVHTCHAPFEQTQ